MSKEEIKKLRKFLEDCNALTVFEKLIHLNPRETIEKYYGRTTYSTVIQGSFIWANTPQGKVFWEDMHDQFIKFQESK